MLASVALKEDPVDTLGQAVGADGGKGAFKQHEIALAMVAALLDVAAKKDPRYTDTHFPLEIDGNPTTAYDWLTALMNLTWTSDSSPEADEKRQLMLSQMKTLRNVPPHEWQNLCINFIARAGHLHQLAGLVARDNLLQQTNIEHNAPSTVSAAISGQLSGRVGKAFNSAASAVAAFNTPQFEMTLTAHPTSTNSIPSMQAQRKLGIAIDAWRHDPDQREKVEDALREFAATPIIPMDGKAMRNIRVDEEADYMLYYLNNAFTDLDRVYASYDKALTAKFPKPAELEADSDYYKPEELRLNVKFHSWGASGDKDGNDKVNGNTTLYGIAAHYDELLQHYQETLGGLAHELPQLKEWYHHIAEARTVAHGYRQVIKMGLGGGKGLTEETFDSIGADLSRVAAPLDAKKFEQELEQVYHATHIPAQKAALLGLMRKVHSFGFSFGEIEYRETAKEYTRLTEALIPGYEGMDEGARLHVLEQVLSNPPQAAELRQAFRELGEGGIGKPYSPEDIGPIAYHTRKRMELARDFPQVIQSHVLAECQQPSQMLEAVLLQHLSADAQGKRPSLSIIPLFEDGERLIAAPDFMKKIMESPVYQQHLKQVAAAHGWAKDTQQIQLAHSDNARRNGAPAARALIYRAHQKIRTVYKEYFPEVTLQFFQGLGWSDFFRGGVRAISATANQFGLHDFLKATYQGVDLLNYMNQPNSLFRVLTRNLTNSAVPPLPKPYTEREENIVEAFNAAKTSYTDVFEEVAGKEGGIDSFLESIGYNEQKAAGANGSRVPDRALGKEESVNARKARTISYSEACQHAGIGLTWLGFEHIKNEFETRSLGVNPLALNVLYETSPIMRDITDRALFGLVRSDLDYAAKLSGNHPLMAYFDREYRAAFKLCYEAYTGKVAPVLEHTRDMRAVLIAEVYPHTADVFADQDHYLDVVRAAQQAWARPRDKEDPIKALQNRLLHNATDTVYHGRTLLVEDTAYAKPYCAQLKIARPHVKERETVAADR